MKIVFAGLSLLLISSTGLTHDIQITDQDITSETSIKWNSEVVLDLATKSAGPQPCLIYCGNTIPNSIDLLAKQNNWMVLEIDHRKDPSNPHSVIAQNPISGFMKITCN